MRITPNNITSLQPDEVFVFGSNESGRHGRGAAKTAMKWGAKWGQAEGLQGRTYGIPTKDAAIRKTLSVRAIQKYVNQFLDVVLLTPDRHFLITEIGCGLAGYSPKEIAPLFQDFMNIDNVSLPQRFIDILTRLASDAATI